MKAKVFAAVVAAVLAVGLMAPAAFADALPDDAGVIIGAKALVNKAFEEVAVPGKLNVRCADDDPDNFEGGLGLPNPLQTKKAYYRFDVAWATLAESLDGETITRMIVCGQVDPAEDTGIGAACGSSSGNNGRSVGRIETANSNDVEYQLTGVGWDVSAGGLFIVTGTAQNAADKAKGRAGILATVQARDLGDQCRTKNAGNDPNKTGGAGLFRVDIVYWISDTFPDIKHTK